jgi:methylamine---glutamate N-methyltransferase subunit A
VCGIVGIHTKTEALRDRLGALLTPMLTAMTSRGPDSAGIAIYEDDLPTGWLRYSVRGPQAASDWEELAADLGADLGREVRVVQRGEGAVLTAAGDPGPVLAKLEDTGLAVVGHGRAMEVFKDVGAPRDICERFAVPERRGYQGLGHTRMATESAVTTDHSHPFAAAADLSLVHNGSFSNYASVRRDLADLGIRCGTDNDSEVAARYIAHHLEAGRGLGDALRLVLKELDGFFTLLVATETEFAVVRDQFACKPAVLAETDDYVAMASEYHALADLPGIDDAEVFEPMPEEVHVWSR